MKRFNQRAFWLSFLIGAGMCSLLSFSAAAENEKWMLHSFNPLNGVEGLAFVIGYFLGTGGFVTYLVLDVSLFLAGWGLYALLSRIPGIRL